MAEEATRLAGERAGGAAPLVPGAVLAGGTWRLEERIGAGGMGEVWRAANLVIPGARARRTFDRIMAEGTWLGSNLLL